MTIGARIVPRIIAFDLDATLWYPEVDMLYGPPYKQHGPGMIRDRSGNEMELMGDSLHILRTLAEDPTFQDCEIAYVSRTEFPEWAIPALETFEVKQGLTMHDMASHLEIFPGRKTTHFANIQKRSGIAYEDMLFFDNERRNIIDCEKLGITCIYTPHGMKTQAWHHGLEEHAKRKVASTAATK